jgi:hypothetical protein
MQETKQETEKGTDLKFFEKVFEAVTRIVGRQNEVPVPGPEIEREVHGNHMRSDVVGHTLALLDAHLQEYPDQATNLLRVVRQEYACRAFGLSNMRGPELRRVLKWLEHRTVSK